jgi:16S rRNA processing protein RimM
MSKNYEIIVGEILAAFGIKGQVKVQSASDFPQRFAVGNSLFVQSVGREMCIESAARHGCHLLLKFAGINDRTAAEALAKSLLLIEKEQVAPLPEGHYYHFQIVGLQVYEKDKKLGVITEVLSHAANDIYVVEKTEGGQLLLPALKSVIKEISLEGGKIQVELPPGLDE